ncbi:MAG: PQQ-binding-like beta-propeller repeat protein [Methyloprofundus sp.]|nr:PQQ-binding-like beta-propeller repeat protein [Methyloprofundus sp.]
MKLILIYLSFLFSCTALAEPLEWPSYGGNLQQTRFIDDASINTTNVEKLKLKWMFQTGIVGSFENTPIVQDGIMYITTPYNHIYALDARTGKRIWRYKHKLGTTIYCCGPNSKGAAISGNLVVMATLDAMLVALDKQTGKLVWETTIANSEQGYSETGAPIIFQDKIIIGVAGAEYGIRGFISAYDLKTGELVWRWYTIPEPDEVQPDGTKGWFGVFAEKADGINDLHRDIAAEKAAIASGEFDNAWEHGGGSSWMPVTIDENTGIIYAAIGNPAPDLDGGQRPGDNRWSASIVALNSTTGKIIWGYQYLPHDIWDLDAASPPILTQAKNKQGKIIPVAIHAGKTGWVYVHDLATGELIRRSDPMVEQKNLFAIPTQGQGTEMLPGANGGVNWSPGAVDPRSHTAYYANLHQPMHYEVRSVPWRQGRLWLGGAFKVIPGKKQSGNVSAVNLDTGKISWQYQTEQPMIGGTLATSGNLLFSGESNGYFFALDSRTGKKLWQFQAGAGVNAAPMAYRIDGKLYIAVAAGGNAQINAPRGGTVVVFTLND